MSSTPVSSESAAQPPSQTATSFPGRFRWLLIASGLVMLWIGFLVVLAIWYANPVTLNRRQVLDSDLVISGRVRSVSSGEVEIIQSYFGTAPAELITVTNLSETGASAGEIYLLSLVQTSAGQSVEKLSYKVTPTGVPHPQRPGEGLPLIYPQSAEVLQQLQELKLP